MTSEELMAMAHDPSILRGILLDVIARAGGQVLIGNDVLTKTSPHALGLAQVPGGLLLLATPKEDLPPEVLGAVVAGEPGSAVN